MQNIFFFFFLEKCQTKKKEGTVPGVVFYFFTCVAAFHFDPLTVAGMFFFFSLQNL